MSAKFDRWISKLTEDVVQGEYGYEPGEFTIYPDHWRALYKEGLTPSQAFRRALDTFAEAREPMLAPKFPRLPAITGGKMSERRAKELKRLDAIGFDELSDFLAETVHTAFRKGCEDGMTVHRAIRDLPPGNWYSAIDWMIWALRVSTGREKASKGDGGR